MVQIVKSRIYSLEEFDLLGQQYDLTQYLENRTHVFAEGTKSLGHSRETWNSIIQWIEESCEGKVIIDKQTEPASQAMGDFTYVLYFELATDLTMFAVRWQAKNE